MTFPFNALSPSGESQESRHARRPSRARRPTLGLERFEERTLLSIALVSVNATGTAVPNGNSDFNGTTLDENNDAYSPPTQASPGNLSADGTKLVFVSDMNDLSDVNNPVGSQMDSSQGTAVFVRDNTTGQTSLVSVTPNGQPANGDSFDPVISPNGRYVAFVSVATNLTTVAGSRTSVSATPDRCRLPLRPRPPDANDDASGPDTERAPVGRLQHRSVRLQSGQ